MKEIILHIGPHKTGSTSIQKALLNNESLLSQQGYQYPRVGFSYMGHHKLPELLKNGNKSKALEILRELNKIDSSIVLSSENFDYLTVDSLKFIQEFLEFDDIRIIYVFRSASEKLVSAWQEHIKHGGVESWSEFMFTHLLKPFESLILNDKKILDRFSEVFGKEKISILNLDCSKNISQEFFNVLNVDAVIKNVKANRSANFKIIEFLRCLNILHIANGYGKSHHLRDKFFALLGNQAVLKEDILKSFPDSYLSELDIDSGFLFSMVSNKFISVYREQFESTPLHSKKVETFLLPKSSFKFEEALVLNIYEQIGTSEF